MKRLNKNGQIGTTITWFTAFFIIFFIMFLFLFVMIYISSQKKVVSDNSGIIVDKQLSTNSPLFLYFLNKPADLDNKKVTELIDLWVVSSADKQLELKNKINDFIVNFAKDYSGDNKKCYLISVIKSSTNSNPTSIKDVPVVASAQGARYMSSSEDQNTIKLITIPQISDPRAAGYVSDIKAKLEAKTLNYNYFVYDPLLKSSIAVEIKFYIGDC